ncbi:MULTISPECIES: LacI family DNA-binding transcriptional regulator [Streptomyces]|uniref:LacI family DNA-binding transcriptional regulator n=2 Tax=Streptomyces TaxID=1883 RepID=A0ABY9J5X8_9ACTN|nr:MULTISPECIES: LacI family DNA-binding transcriptional regulator [unclassified Streptomyces]WLQ63030.1 LacI family DNA-binding transcriptional regulator [Streptomyces sp. Alt3]WSQ76543.1 LacI family transcriptional regulator [Streptomyces sp. NBC_01213]WSQ83872.1 LacI family transcriptional regulator [Streptomyces sp. NBC_01212]WSR10181.1 LacI family transcriptional regulator [Streptomyces sp. NBC_01208]
MPTSTPPPRRTTIYDIARIAGVSHTTVSRYLRFDGQGVRDATKEAISAAIDELGYRPNLAARAMRTRRTGRLAILLPAGQAAGAVRMLVGATEKAHAHGYQIEGVTLDGSAETLAVRMLELAESGMFEGVLSLTPLLADPPGKAPPPTPIVVAAEYDEELRAMGELADATPIAEIIEGLASAGHRTFLHVAGDRDYPTARSRERVYLETVQRLGLHSAGVVGGDWSPETSRRAILDLPAAERVTAVIAANDILAAAAVRGAHERGWRVPDDMVITGWDNNPVGAWLFPALTTVEVDYEELGRRAMHRLVALVRGEAPPEQNGLVATVLWRRSTGHSD